MGNPRNLSPLNSSRRHWIIGSAIAAGAFALRSTNAWATAAEDNNGLSHNAEAIHQEVAFKESPKRIYEALTDAKQFQKLCQLSEASTHVDVKSKPAEISNHPGGEFAVFGGYILGRQIELAPNQRIVQAWREPTWDPGIYSVARFELSEQGAGTRLVFDHTGFPAG
ncbi:MAG TPA: SRPBCC domain-containing protein, partial [Terriglobales bacterium]|nr:SRPBCC domain-containing protein [Terriglobales bacterium]